MYDELVKRLREFASIPEHCENVASCDQCSKESICLSFTNKRIIEVATQAADAIEELQQPKWIPVTERLPEDGSLVGKLIADSDGNIRIASQCAEITLSGGKTVYTDLIDLVSLLAEDTPTTEWEDCTHITHWMPLPEPPKEET